MRLFGSDRIQGMVEKLGMEDDDAIEAGMLSKSIEGAQKKVEGKNYGIRKAVLQYDDVMNKQREIIYGERRRVLEGENLQSEIKTMAGLLADDIISKYLPENNPEAWDLKLLNERLKYIFGMSINTEDKDQIKDKAEFSQNLKEAIFKVYDLKQEILPEDDFRELERVILLQVVDSKWMDHIDAMDQLRKGIGLRSIAQENPVIAYQKEGFDMFDSMNESIREETVRYLMNFQVKEERPQTVARKQVIDIDNTRETIDNALEQKPQQAVRENKPGRNDPCPCGSGKKYKNCHGKAV